MYQLDEDGFFQRRQLPDQRRLSVQPWSVGATLGISMPPPLHEVGVYADEWNYLDAQKALKALREWNPEESPEPDGWVRHPTTGRYRPVGDKALEYVRNDGSIETQIMLAVVATQGQDRVIVDMGEHSEHIGAALPDGTRCFQVTSESSTCEHEPKCRWHDTVYVYLDRCVVLNMDEMVSVSLATLKKRLLGGEEE